MAWERVTEAEAPGMEFKLCEQAEKLCKAANDAASLSHIAATKEKGVIENMVEVVDVVKAGVVKFAGTTISIVKARSESAE